MPLYACTIHMNHATRSDHSIFTCMHSHRCQYFCCGANSFQILSTQGTLVLLPFPFPFSLCLLSLLALLYYPPQHVFDSPRVCVCAPTARVLALALVQRQHALAVMHSIAQPRGKEGEGAAEISNRVLCGWACNSKMCLGLYYALYTPAHTHIYAHTHACAYIHRHIHTQLHTYTRTHLDGDIRQCSEQGSCAHLLVPGKLCNLQHKAPQHVVQVSVLRYKHIHIYIHILTFIHVSV